MFSAKRAITEPFKQRLEKSPEQMQLVFIKPTHPLTEASPEIKELQQCELKDFEFFCDGTLLFAKGNGKNILLAANLKFVKQIGEMGVVSACESISTEQKSPRNN
ncbi:MAG: hypothetical protein ACYCQI_12535 [Gammaproteobacteria bacterium]